LDEVQLEQNRELIRFNKVILGWRESTTATAAAIECDQDQNQNALVRGIGLMHCQWTRVHTDGEHEDGDLLAGFGRFMPDLWAQGPTDYNTSAALEAGLEFERVKSSVQRIQLPSTFKVF
jgi:hypothetical protein